VIKVHVLQVRGNVPEEVRRLRSYVAAGRTRGGHWQSVKKAGTGISRFGTRLERRCTPFGAGCPGLPSTSAPANRLAAIGARWLSTPRRR
jgi:hypothetical protein